MPDEREDAEPRTYGSENVCIDWLREAQELIYAAQSAVKQGHWQVVGRSTFKAKSLLEQVNREAISQLGRERKP